ncbi:MAG: carboxypeptidase M32, partial [Erysipelotrichaceae bacterium]|nr:carboxypeptidase M32 [Erysipelotrichaceae bacterium]
GTPLHHMISSGMHESQSRFLENYIGRRKAFLKGLYPKLQEYFPEQLGNVSLDAFWRAVNASRPSLIRTQADELTYPLHILIRYEIEKSIFKGTADLEHLNTLWNEKYKEYLGVEVPDDGAGILQDVHWSGASFGYFPTYALGSAIGAQLLHAMEKDVNIDEALEKGEFSKITDWLKEHFQQYGARYTFKEAVVKATGEEFDPHYYIDYLKKKYRTLYGLDQ